MSGPPFAAREKPAALQSVSGRDRNECPVHAGASWGGRDSFRFSRKFIACFVPHLPRVRGQPFSVSTASLVTRAPGSVAAQLSRTKAPLNSFRQGWLVARYLNAAVSPMLEAQPMRIAETNATLPSGSDTSEVINPTTAAMAISPPHAFKTTNNKLMTAPPQRRCGICRPPFILVFPGCGWANGSQLRNISQHSSVAVAPHPSVMATPPIRRAVTAPWALTSTPSRRLHSR